MLKKWVFGFLIGSAALVGQVLARIIWEAIAGSTPPEGYAGVDVVLAGMIAFVIGYDWNEELK